MGYTFLLSLLLLLHLSLPVSCQQPNIDSAYKYLNVKELGNNAGFTNKYLESKLYEQGWRKGYSYCAYSVKVWNKMGNVKSPIITGGLAQSFNNKTSISSKDVLYGRKNVKRGSIVVWRKGETYKGHTGLVQYWSKSKGRTVEGNTSSGIKGDQSNGNGFFERTRTIQPRNYFRIIVFTPVIYR